MSLQRILREYRASVGRMLPVLAGNRAVGAACAAGVFFLLLFSKCGYNPWPCPFYSLTKLPCPGCGMTRAFLALMRGEWLEMAHSHPFAPYFLVLGLLCLPGLALSRHRRARWAAKLVRVEEQTGLHALILAMFIGYSMVRMVRAALLFL